MDYSKYRFSKKELAVSLIIWIFISAVFAYFFYRSVIAGILIFMFVPIFIRFGRKKAIEKRKWNLCLEFKEYIQMVAVNLSSGNSVENSFIKAHGDIVSLYGDKSDMAMESRNLIKNLENNVVLENILNDFGERSKIEEISDFADIFSAGKRTGGNLREIIEDTARQIADKIEIKREIKILIAEKELEHRIMCLIPFFILAYIGLTNKGYFDLLYHNVTGIFIMTGCLGAYVGAFVWGEKITAIKG